MSKSKQKKQKKPAPQSTHKREPQEIFFPDWQEVQSGDWITDPNGKRVAIFANGKWRQVGKPKEDAGKGGKREDNGPPFTPRADVVAEGRRDIRTLPSEYPPYPRSSSSAIPASSLYSQRDKWLKAIVIVRETGEEHRTEAQDVIRAMARKLPAELKGDTYKFVIPLKRLKFKQVWKDSGTVSPCVFNATDEYLIHICGKMLDKADQRFYERLACTDSSGIGANHIPTGVQHLVEPYGLAVSRIFLRKGQYLPLADWAKWVGALGMNPYALSDQRTTNQEAAARLSLALPLAHERWRMEYVEIPRPPLILAFKYAGQWTQAQLGHSVYVGPRRGIEAGWEIAVQVDHAHAVKHHTPLDLPPAELKPQVVVQTLDWEAMKHVVPPLD